jgi:hypothetical protein
MPLWVSEGFVPPVLILLSNAEGRGDGFFYTQQVHIRAYKQISIACRATPAVMLAFYFRLLMTKIHVTLNHFTAVFKFIRRLLVTSFHVW